MSARLPECRYCDGTGLDVVRVFDYYVDGKFRERREQRSIECRWCSGSGQAPLQNHRD